MGTLYVVATPIGNREDITLRALRVFREVSVIAAEDTRHTGQLLAHHGISARYLSLHAHNERERAAAIVARLAAGEDVALVSDAGTPLIADPGAHVVSAVRAAGYPVIPIPGPSAFLAAVVASGVVPGPFTFIGFLPPKRAARRSALGAVSGLAHPIVYYEAPHRLRAMLEDVRDVMGERSCVLCRELTKIHEEVREGPVSELIAALDDRPPRGEYVVIIAAAEAVTRVADEETVEQLLRTLLSSGYTPAAAAKAVAAETGCDRAACYQRAVAVKRGIGG